MFSNFFKIAIRNLLKQKIYSFINITGLATGIAVCLLIVLFVQDELSYDKFHKDAENIYRVVLDAKIGDNEFIGATTPAPMAKALINDFPEVEAVTRIRNYGFPVLRYGENVYSEENYFSVDSTFFNVFTPEFIAGNPKTALNKPNSVVLTDKMAKKYFGNEDPVGKFINADNRRDYLVTAVVKEFPTNSHFHFDFLGSLETYRDDANNPFWLSNNFYTYAKLKNGMDHISFENKMNEKFIEYIGPQIQQITGNSYQQMMEAGNKYNYQLQPILDIHLYSKLEGELEPNSDSSYVYMFMLIAVGILCIAIINFMNLSTAKSAGRAKEVGIRKTLGSSFLSLVKQFLSESVIMSLIAIAFSIGIVLLLLPFFNDLAQKNLTLNLVDNIYVLPGLILLAVFIGILSGSYPAFFLASFNPVAVLNGKIKRGAKGSWLRSSLVILQFSVSIILIVGTIIIYNQLHYIQNKNLGFNKDQVIVIHKTDDMGPQVLNFVEELRNTPNIIEASNSNTIIGQNYNSNGYKKSEGGSENTIILWTQVTDFNYKDTYQIKMAEGRYFSKERVTDSTAIVVNQAALKVLGIEGDPIGKEVVQLGPTPETTISRKIIGVMSDYHFESLHQEIRPLAMLLWPSQAFGRYVSVRIAPENVQETLKSIQEKWAAIVGKQAFEYTFFDDDFKELYINETRTQNLFTAFSILAIFIACLGLLGLAAYTAEQKTKEIGIRKVLGASVTSILVLLSKEFARWVIIANVIAWPISYLLMNKWLQDFHYRIDIGYWVFIVSGIVALIIALFTVSSQALKAASTNPAKSLKYE